MVDVTKNDLPMQLIAKDDKYDINGSLIYSPKTRDVIGVYHSETDGNRIYAKLPECPDLWSGMNGQDSVGDVFRHRQASSSVFDARTCAVKLRPLVGEVHWDKGFQRFQAAIDKVLPDTINYLIDFSRNERRYIVYATSDTKPGTYYVGDRDRGTLDDIGHRYPHLEGKLQGMFRLKLMKRVF